ncbi:conserved hypothetical protein [Desulfamplus magnetovallimortis]|uniref:DUF2281 domain-containing protein n=1 Tax=Desulfamplus magnetovallimortis TaxID=1246637 RepID=A0A1W1H8N2_9BACT|nr:hypothetical protein [Desulfamplus magnetovallimortis]SLM28813.1 conserved hypothetical protein [Desulfamplus magnetovallimortis]
MNIMMQELMEEAKSLPLDLQQETLDFVRFLKLSRFIEPTMNLHETGKTNGARVANLMEKIARRGSAFRDIKEPSDWQRNIRKDRLLHGRDD